MIGLFVVTHGSLGESLIHCACHVMNKRPAQLTQLGFSATDDPLDMLPTGRQLLQMVDSGEGVLILTDVFGASPANMAMKLLRPGYVEAVAGVNLPMLLRSINYREKDMAALVSKAVAGGRDGVMLVRSPRNA